MSEISIEFGDDIMQQAGFNQLRPADSAEAKIKFDAKGSVHVMCRNEDGKLLKDIPVKELAAENTSIEDYYERMNELDALRRANAGSKLIGYLFGAGIIALLILCIVLIYKMNGGV